ncbi:hypothetical protein H6P81_014459 [Aristolochia fimbriata]|uniref:KANL3/Tex30 alpha/beta hydrolase-like domain-containing protein n=1 Tax=Aristolochia fimbriata TaxID=158543 RepID=A0AAV7EKD5_ARIFI|nr:hypothetical protein H6P81_014459 [Aristolochia fimbriata]
MASSRPSKRPRKDESEDHPTVSTPESASPLVVFAHGAGAPSTSEWMIRWKEMLGKALHAVEVVTFDYPYMSAGKRRPPPKADKLVEYHSDVVRKAVEKHPGHPLILAGKSMGSRVSCMVANSGDFDVAAIVCLGYPLKSPGGGVRDEILLELTVPIMFVQGSKDALCPLEKLSGVLKKMKSVSELHVIDGGDHSFKIGKKFMESHGVSLEEAEETAVTAIAVFVAKAFG